MTQRTIWYSAPGDGIGLAKDDRLRPVREAERAVIGRRPDEQGDHQAAKSSSGILEDSECSHTEGDWFSRPGVLRKSAGVEVRIVG